MSDITQRVPPEGSNNSLLFITQLVYILHGLSMLIGLMTGATIISAFLFGWPSIAAVVLNYVKALMQRDIFRVSFFMANSYILVRYGLDLIGNDRRRCSYAFYCWSFCLAWRLCCLKYLGCLSHYFWMVAIKRISSSLFRLSNKQKNNQPNG